MQSLAAFPLCIRFGDVRIRFREWTLCKMGHNCSTLKVCCGVVWPSVSIWDVSQWRPQLLSMVQHLGFRAQGFSLARTLQGLGGLLLPVNFLSVLYVCCTCELAEFGSVLHVCCGLDG